MPEPGIKELLEAGLHFGHQTRRWDPRMRPYIFGERDGIHIIDLLQTEHLLAEARRFAADVASKGGTILFVGTKKQARDAIKEWAERCGHAVREPALARRAVDQLPHDVGPDRAPARADHPAGRGPARPAAHQGAHGARGRAREARVQPRRRARDEAPAAGGADHRSEDRDDRGARGRAPANPDHRPGRLERRPGARSTIPIPGNDDSIRSCELVVRTIGEAVYESAQSWRQAEAKRQPRRKTAAVARRKSASAPRPRSVPARRPRRRPLPPSRQPRGPRSAAGGEARRAQ